ncbi:DinB family protein [Pedococcus bigeumensis]|uniref:DinB family protein n=1 Tax=Pedococcus bigeumensis TaxID=433644 RepID=A0A502CX63_9MICO|nr:DinB family protein [Pedococcus bigeumensis]TPG17413.1 DinB family protein [Pedococcus bigeumensis]
MGNLDTDSSGQIVPDTKDWTWTLQRPCPDCGFEAGSVARGDIAPLTLTLTAPWTAALARGSARERPAPAVWSPLEYACHVRDVCRIFTGRIRLMLEQDGPQFANWDQDETAVADRYGEQDPAVVSGELQEAAAVVAAAFASVRDDQWDRTGLRSDGSEFTALTLGQYFLHDLAHHLVDVGA